MIVLWVFYVFLIFCIIFLILDVRKPKNFPPGPRWYPLLGNLTYFARKHSKLGYRHLVWEDLRKTYGNIVGIKVGRQLVCTVSDSNSIMEVLTRNEFEGRPDGYIYRMRTFGQKLGIVFSEGEFWQRQRKFSMQHLKNFGFGGKAMQFYLEEETKELINILKRKCFEPILVNDLFGVGVINVLWAMTAGQRFSHDDDKLNELLKLVEKSFRAFDSSGSLLNQLPFLRYIAPTLTGYCDFKSTVNSLNAFLEETIHGHKKTICSSHARDFIDSFLLKMTVNDSSFSHEQLVSLCIDFFMAGSETTTNTLTFSMFYMMKYQDVQKKVQMELEEVVGRKTLPSLDDRTKLIYTEAVLMEIIRLSNVPPLGIAHRAIKTTTIGGKTIPKGAIVLTNLYGLHMDETYWKSSNEFIPERFINEDGKIKSHDKHYLPFGYGKRRCIGETLAKANIFMFFTAILYNFHLKSPEMNPNPKLELYDGLTLSPKPFKVLMVPRNV